MFVVVDKSHFDGGRVRADAHVGRVAARRLGLGHSDGGGVGHGRHGGRGHHQSGHDSVKDRRLIEKKRNPDPGNNNICIRRKTDRPHK